MNKANKEVNFLKITENNYPEYKQPKVEKVEVAKEKPKKKEKPNKD